MSVDITADMSYEAWKELRRQAIEVVRALDDVYFWHASRFAKEVYHELSAASAAQAAAQAAEVAEESIFGETTEIPVTGAGGEE